MLQYAMRGAFCFSAVKAHRKQFCELCTYIHLNAWTSKLIQAQISFIYYVFLACATQCKCLY